jgi:hypothetical protein
LIKSFFFRIILSVIIGFIFIIIISTFTDISGSMWSAVLSGLICALFYVVSGYFSYYYASKQKQRSFNRFFLFSIAGRFLFVIGILLLVIKFSNINTEIFIVSFFIWYFVFQILEVNSLIQLLRKKS